jgi:LPS export ABC transporter protein LptC
MWSFDRQERGIGLMIKIKIVLLTTLATLCLACLVLFFKGGQVGYDTKRIIDSMPLNVDMQLSGVNFTEVNRGKREWTLEAETLNYSKSEDLFVFDSVRATFYASDGPMQVTGDKGYYNREEKKVRLVGRVQATDSQGYSLSTRELRYDVETRIVFAPGFFQVEGPRVNLNGSGLSVDTRDNRIKAVGRPTLTLKSDDNTL